MLRLIHNQTVQGGILVDDIDDGLPNKEIHRLGSTADPKGYLRDGYANRAKQPCYVPYTRAAFPTIAGYINLNQTSRVNFSAGKGKIQKLKTAGLITVVSMTAAQLAKPAITGAAHNTPLAGDVTITGTTFLSIAPDITSVTFAQGTGATAPAPLTLTAAQILAGGGTVSGTSIVVKAASFTTAPVLNNTVYVTANEQNSNTFVLT